MKPSATSVTFHRYGKQISVTLNGENLWFCYHIQVGPHKKKVLAKDTSQRSLQFVYNPEDESKMSSDIDHVRVTLSSHFCNPVKDGKVEVTHKVNEYQEYIMCSCQYSVNSNLLPPLLHCVNDHIRWAY